MEQYAVIPNLIIPGFPKSGTSSLFEYLLHHPEIYGSIKEPHLYSINNGYDNRFKLDNPKSFYSLFDGGQKASYLIEASTTYMISSKAPGRIYNDNPGCKFILIARDPIERVLSHYNWMKSLGFVKKPFRDEILDWLDKPFNPDVNFNGNYKNYIEFSYYGTQISRYLEKFDNSSLFIVSLEELKLNKQQVLNKIFEFLDLELINVADTSVVNSTKNKFIFDQVPLFLRKAGQYVPKGIRQKIRNKIINKVFYKKINSVTLSPKDKEWVYSLLEKEILITKSLGFKFINWKTVNEIEGKTTYN